MEAMEEKLFRKLKDEEKNDEFIAVERVEHFSNLSGMTLSETKELL